MATKSEIQRQQESNEQLRLECLAGFDVVLDHPICTNAIKLASDMLIASVEASGFEADLINQLGRSLGSVAANFAEGHGRSMFQDKLRFLRLARGSAYESVVHARIYYVEGADQITEICALAIAVDNYIAELTR